MGAETRVFDPHGLPLPDSAPATHPKVKELRESAEWSEGMVWCSPERHGAMTGIGTNTGSGARDGVRESIASRADCESDGPQHYSASNARNTSARPRTCRPPLLQWMRPFSDCDATRRRRFWPKPPCIPVARIQLIHVSDQSPPSAIIGRRYANRDAEGLSGGQQTLQGADWQVVGIPLTRLRGRAWAVDLGPGF